jgi:hypothetical protein
MEEKINTVNFLQEWNKIWNKLLEISKIEKLCGNGKDFTGIRIYNLGVLYKSETYYQGCDLDTFDFFVGWNEINEPIEYFQKKYADEIAEYYEKTERERNSKRLESEREEIATYLKLKEKYEGTKIREKYENKNEIY